MTPSKVGSLQSMYVNKEKTAHTLTLKIFQRVPGLLTGLFSTSSAFSQGYQLSKKNEVEMGPIKDIETLSLNKVISARSACKVGVDLELMQHTETLESARTTSVRISRNRSNLGHSGSETKRKTTGIKF